MSAKKFLMLEPIEPSLPCWTGVALILVLIVLPGLTLLSVRLDDALEEDRLLESSSDRRAD
jgi:hypothetical protein